MANNRMYLRCRTCGKTILLGKVFGGDYYCFYDNMTEELDKFYETHAFCQESPKESTKGLEPEFIPQENVHYENQYELAYETFYKRVKEIKEITNENCDSSALQK